MIPERYVIYGKRSWKRIDICMCITESYYYINGAGYAGIGLMGAGLGVAVWGVIRFMSGNSQLGRLATQFNSGNGYISELSLDYSPTGIALVYKF